MFIETKIMEIYCIADDFCKEFVSQQEMVVNSVCHRDYSIKGTEIQIKMFDERLVFETPGKLPSIVRIGCKRATIQLGCLYYESNCLRQSLGRAAGNHYIGNE